jgi:hypothetical protein
VTLRLLELEDRTVPALLNNALFPADNPWNQRITTAPVAANSAAVMNNITTVYGNGRLHPDFGQDYNDTSDLYGIPYNVVHGNSTAKTTFVIDGYPGESDVLPAPVPSGVVIEGDFQNGPNVGVDNRGDSHLLIYDVDNNVAYEFYRASRPTENTDGKWHADQETVWDMKANTFRTLGYTSADAAGLSLLVGLVRPDEGLPTSEGGQGVINHAIRFTLQNAVILNQFLYPASHVANAGNTNTAIQPPMGARFRLKASVDISQMNPEARVIAQAMKDYGLIVADNGSNFFFSGASYSVNASNQQVLTWNDNDIQDSVHGLKSLHYSDFEVVDLRPIVTGLGTTSGAAGTSVTITGQNFSGAAGRLKVLFGATAATSVTVVDDTHITAVVPAGSGTVDVRVQSGASVGANSQDIMSPVFGYGMSTMTTADRFTYGAAGGPPPTVTAVSAGSTAQRSKVTSLQVTFSTIVTLPTNAAAAFTLTRIGDGAAVTFSASAATTGGVTVVTLTSFGGTASSGSSLADGRYQLTVVASQVTVNGQQLDGNGDGTAGDNYTFADSGTTSGNQLYRLYGDANGDRIVNAADLSLFRSAYGSTDSTFDVNGDGVINAADLTAFRANYGMST